MKHTGVIIIENQNTNFQNSNNYLENRPNGFLMFSIIDSLSGWMKFIGIYTIIVGAITCVGIITSAIGIPMIFSGNALLKASRNIKIYKNSNSPYILNEVLTYINKYFKIQGIFILIGLVLSLIYFVGFVFLIAASIR